MKPPAVELLDPVPPLLDSRAYTGVYSHPAYGKITVSPSENPERLHFAHYVLSFEIAHFQDNSFLRVLPNGKLIKSEFMPPVTFEAAADGTITGLRFKFDELADPIEFERDGEIQVHWPIPPTSLPQLKPIRALVERL